MRALRRRVAVAIGAGLACVVVFGSISYATRSVRSEVPGAVIPAWQLNLLARGSRLIPNPLESASRRIPALELTLSPFLIAEDFARNFEQPFWTPSTADIDDATVAFLLFLSREAAAFEKDIATLAPITGCSSATILRVPHSNQQREDWFERTNRCEAFTLLNELPSYRAQYFGISHEGRRAVYISGYCNSDRGIWPERLLPHSIQFLDGGNCFFHAFYDQENDSIERFWVNPGA